MFKISFGNIKIDPSAKSEVIEDGPKIPRRKRSEPEKKAEPQVKPVEKSNCCEHFHIYVVT